LGATASELLDFYVPLTLSCCNPLQVCSDALPKSLATFSGPLEMQTGIESLFILPHKTDIFRREIM
jgi:hypothetical protein